MVFSLLVSPTPRSTRTDNHFPHTTLFQSGGQPPEIRKADHRIFGDKSAMFDRKDVGRHQTVCPGHPATSIGTAIIVHDQVEVEHEAAHIGFPQAGDRKSTRLNSSH